MCFIVQLRGHQTWPVLIEIVFVGGGGICVRGFLFFKNSLGYSKEIAVPKHLVCPRHLSLRVAGRLGAYLLQVDRNVILPYTFQVLSFKKLIAYVAPRATSPSCLWR